MVRSLRSLTIDKDEMIFGTPNASANQNYCGGLKKSALLVQCVLVFTWTMLTPEIKKTIVFDCMKGIRSFVRPFCLLLCFFYSLNS